MQIKELFLKNKAVKNAGWLIAGKVVQMAISFLVGLLTARYLGPSNYGVLNYATAYTAFFMALCTLGINSVIMKEFIDRPEQEGMIIGTSLVLKAVSSILSAIMIICIVNVVDRNDKTAIIVVAICSIGPVFNIFETFNYWFQSKLQSKVTAIVTLVAYIVTSAYRVFLLATQKNIFFFAFAASVDYITVAIGLLYAYKKYNGRRLSFSISYGKKLLGKSWHYILPGLMVSIYGYTDKFMLKHMINSSENAYYSTASTLCTIWCFILSAIIDSLVPAIMEANNRSKEEFDTRNRQLYAIVFYISVAVSVGFCILAKPLILILYGEEYAGAIVPLRVITWYTAFSYLGVARSAWIVCLDRQKYIKYLYIAAALSNIILNLIFIPIWKASGAALASCITQFLTIMVIPFFIKGLRENTLLIIDAIKLKGIGIKIFNREKD